MNVIEHNFFFLQLCIIHLPFHLIQYIFWAIEWFQGYLDICIWKVFKSKSHKISYINFLSDSNFLHRLKEDFKVMNKFIFEFSFPADFMHRDSLPKSIIKKLTINGTCTKIFNSDNIKPKRITHPWKNFFFGYKIGLIHDSNSCIFTHLIYELIRDFFLVSYYKIFNDQIIINRAILSNYFIKVLILLISFKSYK